MLSETGPNVPEAPAMDEAALLKASAGQQQHQHAKDASAVKDKDMNKDVDKESDKEPNREDADVLGLARHAAAVFGLSATSSSASSGGSSGAFGGTSSGTSSSVVVSNANANVTALRKTLKTRLKAAAADLRDAEADEKAAALKLARVQASLVALRAEKLAAEQLLRVLHQVDKDNAASASAAAALVSAAPALAPVAVEPRVAAAQNASNSNSNPLNNTHFSLPCLSFNIQDKCADDMCPFVHTCLYCRKPEHNFTACLDKPCICLYYNTPSDNKCTPNKCPRLNVCLFCLGDHPFSVCPHDHPKESAESCNNWNATGICASMESCPRSHTCTRCNGSHTTFECPVNADSFLQNPRLDWIYDCYQRCSLVTRREVARNAESGNNGGYSGSSSRQYGGNGGSYHHQYNNHDASGSRKLSRGGNSGFVDRDDRDGSFSSSGRDSRDKFSSSLAPIPATPNASVSTGLLPASSGTPASDVAPSAIAASTSFAPPPFQYSGTKRERSSSREPQDREGSGIQSEDYFGREKRGRSNGPDDDAYHNSNSGNQDYPTSRYPHNSNSSFHQRQRSPSSGGGGMIDERRMSFGRRRDSLGSLSGGPSGPPGGGELRDRSVIDKDRTVNPCFQFNKGGKCGHGRKCWYRHACMRCESLSHGEYDCDK
ncbi:UNVERIFIED_CONTAM: hypothetical protein HDU68_012742 [Siphonaria sp. JEL0065]|nr:hypothetical protein HDU68_012742 [Siphonaria sp. JEL0065]